MGIFLITISLILIYITRYAWNHPLNRPQAFRFMRKVSLLSIGLLIVGIYVAFK